MRCVDCRWFNKENEFCMKDGGSVFNPDADDSCEYADNMTVFDKITASPEVLAPHLVYGDKEGYFYSTIIEGERFLTIVKAFAATVAKQKEVCDD